MFIPYFERMLMMPWGRFLCKSKEDLPKKIRLDACNLCQLDCDQCWIRGAENEIKKTKGFGYLKFKDFKKLVNDNNFEEIELSNNGEIFLNPELDKIIEYAYKKKIKLTAANGVNLNTLSEKMAKCLVKYKFQTIVVSIDGATQETYQIYRRKGNINNVFQNIEMINKYKNKYNSEYPKLIYKFIVFGHNEHEIELAKQKAKDLNMSIKFSQNEVWGYSPVKDVEMVKKQTGICDDVPHMPLWVHKYAKNEFPELPCLQIFEEPQIDWNGNLRGCCWAFSTNLANGIEKYPVNVFKEGFFNALNEESFLQTKYLLTHIYDSYSCTNQNVRCAKCWMFKELKRQHVSVRIP